MAKLAEKLLELVGDEIPSDGKKAKPSLLSELGTLFQPKPKAAKK